MSMLQVGVIGVLGVLFAVQFKSGKSEYAVYISVAVSLLLFGCMLERLRDAVDSLGRIGNYIKVDQRFFGTMMKMIGILQNFLQASAKMQDIRASHPR